MSLKKAIDNLKFDSRMVEINLKNQSLTREELAGILGKLPDSQANATELDIEAEHFDDDMDEPI